MTEIIKLRTGELGTRIIWNCRRDDEDPYRSAIAIECGRDISERFADEHHCTSCERSQWQATRLLKLVHEPSWKTSPVDVKIEPNKAANLT